MNELLERLYAELRHYGPNDKFNKGFYLTLTERVMKELGVDDTQYVKLPEVCNGTDYELRELNEITWKEAGTEESDYSIMTATTYISPDGTIAKKVFSDGMAEYYYT